MKEYYTVDNIIKTGAHYNIIIGERSNGKTYSALEYALEEYFKNGSQIAYVRRLGEDFRIARNSRSLLESHVDNGLIHKLSKGMWTGVHYFSRAWYLYRWDSELKKRVVDDTPFMYGFAVSEMERDKGGQYPHVGNLIYDEFLTRGRYLNDEFILFMNLISTITRDEERLKIFMIGNTVNKYCPYFEEMGLINIQKMKQGAIDVYKYGDSNLKVAVEYCDKLKRRKNSDVYFAFNNPRLQMITGGSWEIDIYPHLPYKYGQSDIIFTFFIEFNREKLQCEVIQKNDESFIYIHRKTTPFKNYDDVIFSPDYTSNPNRLRKINNSSNKICRAIGTYFNSDKVFYQNNEVGEIVRNYLNWCRTNK